MKGKYMLIWTYSDSGKINYDWYESEGDALQSILNTLPGWWMIIGVGDDGPQRFPNEHPIIIRCSFQRAKQE